MFTSMFEFLPKKDTKLPLIVIYLLRLIFPGPREMESIDSITSGKEAEEAGVENNKEQTQTATNTLPSSTGK